MPETERSTDSLQVEKTLHEIDAVLKRHGLSYWLEAGSALSAYRDGRILDWEHDLDLALWRRDLPILLRCLDDFKQMGFDVVVQKGLPFVDNIVQIRLPRLPDGSVPRPNQVDFYLYTEQDDFAYMRWIQKPEGMLAGVRKNTFIFLRNFLNGRTRAMSAVSKVVPFSVRWAVFRIFFEVHLRLSSCIYHRFPARFFRTLKKLEFYGVPMQIAADTDAYLSFRYGPDWRVPDREFNQKGRWRGSEARVLLKMSTLPPPPFEPELLRRY